MWMETQAAAKALKVTPQRQEIAGPDEIEHAFTSLVNGRAQGLIVLPHAVPMPVDPRSWTSRQSTGSRGCTLIASMCRPAA